MPVRRVAARRKNGVASELHRMNRSTVEREVLATDEVAVCGAMRTGKAGRLEAQRSGGEGLGARTVGW